MGVTIKDVAKAAGVSISTVSKVMLPASQKSNSPISILGQVVCGNDAGGNIVDVDPAYLAVKCWLTQHDMGKMCAH